MRTYRNVLAILLVVLLVGCASIGRAPTFYLSEEASTELPGFFGKVIPEQGDPLIKRICKIDGKEFPCILMKHRGSYYAYKTNENGYIILEYRILGDGEPVLTYKEDEAI